MSPDEQVYIRPHNLAIPQKILGKKYYIYSKSPEAHPEKDEQFSRSFDGQFSKSSAENEYVNPHRMEILQNKQGIN